MDWMKRMIGKVCGLIPGSLNLIGGALTALWDEVADGHHRLSWWGLLAIAATAGWLI